MHAIARRLGGMLAEAIREIRPEAPAEMLVIPIPLHRSKYRQRGFNQSWSLAAHAVRALRKADPEWRLARASRTLMRLRPTESQTGLTAHQRRLNMRGAFQVSHPAAVAMRHVLLVDDILTTGATARAAAGALAEAGAASVWVATLARASRSGREGDFPRRLSPEGLRFDAEAPGQSAGEGAWDAARVSTAHPSSLQDPSFF